MSVAAPILLWLLGLCVGSFLNVVIYRLPAGLSVARPARSFCPGCERSIAWYDNLPLVSWLLLRARCRGCGLPIPVQYPLVEAMTGFAFVLVHHLIFVEAARVGISGFPTLPRDLPLLASWLVLVAALIACSGMDLVSYMVDTRLTDLAVLAGLVFHAAWPRDEFLMPQAAGAAGAAAVAAFLASILALRLAHVRGPPESAAEPEADPTAAQRVAGVEPGQGGAGSAGDAPAGAPQRSPSASASDLSLGIVVIVVFVSLTLWMIAGAGGRAASWLPQETLLPAGFLAAFVTIVLAAGRPRESDAEIHDAIESERPLARRMIAADVLWLAPIAAAGAAAWLLVAQSQAAGDAWRALVAVRAGPFTPIAGLVFAMHGAMAAAAAGWVVRIVFTLAFGREAFATGDIYILAAAGAAAGWDVALLGFVLAVFIAAAGWTAGLVLKRNAMIPFGPWLTLGFVAALWLNRPASGRAAEQSAALLELWRERPDLLLTLGLVLAAAFVLAVLAAGLVRRYAGGPGQGGPDEQSPDRGV